jgi:hypothetical protein
MGNGKNFRWVNNIFCRKWEEKLDILREIKLEILALWNSIN